jgi:DHA3 family tetracycline resistance protein-like MFS transporter
VARNLLGRVTSARILQPLKNRDFALLTTGRTVSLLGDGFFFVALAWQVYDISNVPTALSIVGVAHTLPMVLLVLVGGALADRYDRRKLMIWADAIRAVSIGLLGILSLTGAIELWHVIVLIGFVGLGDAFFNPASSAIVPDIVPEHDLAQANSLLATLRPLMVRLLGPALAGLIIAVAGNGVAFLIDAGSFAVSMVAIAAMRTRPHPVEGEHGLRQTIGNIAVGLRYVKSKPWIWATLVSAMLSLLVFLGPVEVLVPFLVRNQLNLGADSLGLIFAAGGVGAIMMALTIGARGLPRRRVTVMFLCWSIGVALMATYGVMTALWQALIASFILHALFQLGEVIWVTMLQQNVPRHLLGRVTSLDWLISLGLVPLSYAITGPLSAAFGPSMTMVGTALIGALLMVSLYFVPGVRDPEQADFAQRSRDEDRRATAAVD